jgi:hypothetical protein
LGLGEKAVHLLSLLESQGTGGLLIWFYVFFILANCNHIKANIWSAKQLLGVVSWDSVLWRIPLKTAGFGPKCINISSFTPEIQGFWTDLWRFFYTILRGIGFRGVGFTLVLFGWILWRGFVFRVRAYGNDWCAGGLAWGL